MRVAVSIKLMLRERELGGQWGEINGQGLLHYREWSDRGRYEGGFEGIGRLGLQDAAGAHLASCPGLAVEQILAA
jgi:hypothetical protein